VSGDICGDNRFEVIEKCKQKLIEATNIETSPDEMAVLDSILFRFWQMGWLPAAEPEKHTEERTETHACDTISRRAAIDAMTSGVILVTNNNVDAVKKVMELFIDKIKNLPPVQPERKTGKWIDGQCSNCGCDTPAYIIDWKWQKDMDANYCPNCGAYMGGEQDEAD